MNRIRHLAYIVGGLAASMLVLGSAPAFATRLPPVGGFGDPPILPQHTAPTYVAASGGMPGWQITLIAAGTAVLAATLAVVLDRLRTARRHRPGWNHGI